ncbi:hypothetical protein GCM10010442_37840 [Kitasatospora kifunensis]
MAGSQRIQAGGAGTRGGVPPGVVALCRSAPLRPGSLTAHSGGGVPECPGDRGQPTGREQARRTAATPQGADPPARRAAATRTAAASA